MRLTKKARFPRLSREATSEKELAEILGVTVQTISRTVNGKRDFNRWQRQKLAEFYGISESELLKEAV